MSTVATYMEPKRSDSPIDLPANACNKHKWHTKNRASRNPADPLVSRLLFFLQNVCIYTGLDAEVCRLGAVSFDPWRHLKPYDIYPSVHRTAS